MAVRTKQCSEQCWAQNKHTGFVSHLTSPLWERLSILEEQHGVLHAEIDLCDREVISAEESQMTSEQLSFDQGSKS